MEIKGGGDENGMADCSSFSSRDIVHSLPCRFHMVHQRYGTLDSMEGEPGEAEKAG